ncbi:MAG TPA: leucine--tRNA ligase [Candidatus Paceibacterota bacterium]|nr:leucine--tRNA ligase [Candidatus Paceibacterota bacterium]
MRQYDHSKIEKKWQKAWAEAKLYQAPDSAEGKENFYLLVEFPYPSGNLHVGHWYAYAMPDILARHLRMKGSNVLYPIGFDAFGLPAENAAIKNYLNPRIWTEQNILHMTKQIGTMGVSFDWSRKISTIDPAYYKWTQWLFLQLFNANLAYRKETAVNWCPKDKTVLANEQVVAGRCERCDSEVVQKQMLQWNLKITEYADRLIDDLDVLDWPEQIKEAQRNWIGRSEGAEIDFYLDFGDETINARTGPDGKKAHITVFTTRPDTLFGATYLVLSPEHPWVTLALGHKTVLKNNDAVAAYVAQANKKTELERQENKEKTGVELQGVVAINPATGEKIPMYVADYVLAHYGAGAIMAVPAHDERDFEFAKKFQLPIKSVIEQQGVYVKGEISENVKEYIEVEIFTGTGKLKNSANFDGLPSEQAKSEIIAEFGRSKKTYRLRDWIISRQRYWGVPIPIIHCPKCGAVPVPEEQLPVLLPDVEDYLPSGEGKSPLAKVEAFVNVSCPKCGGAAERETDTLDTFVDSSWYFLRYTDPKNEKEFAGRAMQDNWMPVDLYSGGAEHTTMHLLYSRFWHKALFDLGLVADSEPYKRRMSHGIILGPDHQKMSKSRGNVIDPDALVERLGADTVRLYLAFIGPYNEAGSYPWNPDGVVGVRRFIERVWRLQEGVQEADVPELDSMLHATIRKVEDDIRALKFNTAIAQLMKFINETENYNNRIGGEQWKSFIKLLAPFAPHLAEELWQETGHKSFIFLESWPLYDAARIKNAFTKWAIQINGKTRAVIELPADADEKTVQTAAHDAVITRMLGKKIGRTIVVPGRLVNFVLDEAPAL